MAGTLVLSSLLGLLYDSKIEPASNGEVGEILSSEEDGQIRRSKRRFTFNCSVWKVPRFLVLTACGFFAMFGRSIVYVHLVKYSEDLGMSSSVSSRLIFFLGLNVALGRFACGFLCSLKRLDNWYIYQGVLLVSGVSTMLLTLARHYEELVAYAVVFGFCDGAFATLLNILAFTCVDPSRAASVFGYILMTASVTSMVGPPLSGLTADKLGSYEPAFYMAGGALVAASLPPCVLHCIRNREVKRTELSPIDNENTEDAQEFEKLNRHDGLCMDEPLKITHNDRKPVVPGHELFVSTV
ncbi:hypothetical protein OS493_017958 [Desmophyllum pertusum]|uniref:Uncharacterized protein n=1 Tax=Desmophyllum pertusum TaxID=174260 RepID=A0A9W9Z3Q8_9CNID|nr:hypothetical protein OS493_017958 [Desmophyllum pertusum]